MPRRVSTYLRAQVAASRENQQIPVHIAHQIPSSESNAQPAELEHTVERRELRSRYASSHLPRGRPNRRRGLELSYSLVTAFRRKVLAYRSLGGPELSGCSGLGQAVNLNKLLGYQRPESREDGPHNEFARWPQLQTTLIT